MSNKYLIVLAFMVVSSNIMSMEQQKKATCEKTIYDLPEELYTYMAQFLGGSIVDTIKNIKNLSQVNKNFYEILNSRAQLIGDIIKKKFGKEKILDLFNNAVREQKIGLVKEMLKLELISSQDKIKPLYKEQYQTPLNMVIDEIVHYDNLKWFEVIEDLLKIGFDINENLTDGRTALYRALNLNKLDLFRFLLDHGADPYAPFADNKRTIFDTHFLKEDKKMRMPFFEMLKDKGFIQSS